jgi:hypothetical protein
MCKAKCKYDGGQLKCMDIGGCRCPECGTIWAFCPLGKRSRFEHQLEIRPGALLYRPIQRSHDWEEALLP